VSVGLALLKCLLKDKRDISALREHNVADGVFEKEEVTVFHFIEDYFLKYGQLPKIETVERETEVDFPEFPDEPFGYWLQGLLNRTQSNLFIEAAKEIRSAVSSGDLDDAKKSARKLVIDIDQVSPADHVWTLSELAPAILQEHDKRQKAGQIAGVPFGLPYLDRVSDGMQPADTIALVGRPGVGKSYFLLQMALNAYDFGKVPLVVTLEMSPKQCARRIMALRTGVSATLIRLGRMSHWGRDKVVVNLEEMLELGDRPFYFLQGGMAMTVEDLLMRVRELRPSALYVDGAYLLRTKNTNDSRWERVAESSECLKSLSIEYEMPVLGSYQFNRRGAGSLGNIGYSDSIGQLASIVLSIDDEHLHGHASWTARQYKLLELLKGREGEKGVIKVLYDMERMKITQEEVLSGYEEESAADPV
jgi:replicative DNA helicase